MLLLLPASIPAVLLPASIPAVAANLQCTMPLPTPLPALFPAYHVPVTTHACVFMLVNSRFLRCPPPAHIYTRTHTHTHLVHSRALRMHAHRRYAKASYGRGAGVPLSCRNGTVDDAALCYTPCKPTFNGVGPVCWDKCSSQHGGDTFDGGECDRQTVDQPSCSRVVLAIPTAHRTHTMRPLNYSARTA